MYCNTYSMLSKEIEIIKLPIPHLQNDIVMNYLQKNGQWNFVFDRERNISPKMLEVVSPSEKSDAGLATISYSKGLEGTTKDNYLNFFGDLIFFHCKEKSQKYHFDQVSRYYWNLYSRSSKCLFHTDEHHVNRFISIVYNLHSNDGGTQFKTGTVLANESEAVIFPSHLLHKGLAPKKNKWRLSLNIVATLKENYE